MADRTQDQKMAEEVRRALKRDARLPQEGISVQTRRGVVTLAGKVGRDLDRLAAAEDAWRVRGVTEVKNHLHVQAAAPRGSMEIAAQIADALARDERVDLRGIVVEVAEGLVRLSGAVSTEAERQAAEEIARRTEGVVQLSNDLTVSPARRRPDREIEEDVRSALDGDARLSDPTRIRVRSVAGTVRLEGSVPSAEERESAEKDAWYTADVVYVENRLRIEGRHERPAAA